MYMYIYCHKFYFMIPNEGETLTITQKLYNFDKGCQES